jgi:hypothetical protein
MNFFLVDHHTVDAENCAFRHPQRRTSIGIDFVIIARSTCCPPGSLRKQMIIIPIGPAHTMKHHFSHNHRCSLRHRSASAIGSAGNPLPLQRTIWKLRVETSLIISGDHNIERRKVSLTVFLEKNSGELFVAQVNVAFRTGGNGIFIR